MSFTSLGERRIRAVRKRHSCSWCGHAIEIGEAAVYRVYEFDGDFMREYMHPECFAALSNYPEPDDLIDGFGFGDFARGRCDDRSGLPPEFAPDGCRLETAS